MAFPEEFIKSTSKAAAKELYILKFTAAHVGKKDATTGLIEGYSVKFLAFLTSFNQNFTSTWNTTSVYGRNDPIATFQGTQRNISLGWDVPAEDINVAKQNLERCNSLAQLLYPSYTANPSLGSMAEQQNDDAQVFAEMSQNGAGGLDSSDIIPNQTNALSLSKAPLMRIKYANLIDNSLNQKDGLLGFIGSYSFTPDISMGTFDDGTNLYPKVIGISVDFTVLHEHELGFVTGSSTTFGPNSSFPFGG